MRIRWPHTGSVSGVKESYQQDQEDQQGQWDLEKEKTKTCGFTLEKEELSRVNGMDRA